jgi:hypothetical protein
MTVPWRTGHSTFPRTAIPLHHVRSSVAYLIPSHPPATIALHLNPCYTRDVAALHLHPYLGSEGVERTTGTKYLIYRCSGERYCTGT